MPILLILVAAIPGLAEDDIVDGFVARMHHSPVGTTMPYRIFIPLQYDKAQRYPLIIWLHGAGGAGTDNLAQISEDQLLGTHTWTEPRNQSKYPAFVLVPQSPRNWVASGLDRLSIEMQMVLEILDSVRKEFNIDAARIYVLGQSDGGYGTWNLVSQRPSLFAAAVPLCGGGDPATAKRLASMPLWVFHGRRDDVIPVTESRKMISAIQKAGGHPRYTEYPNIAHDIWPRALTEPDLPGWLFSQHR